MRLPPGKITYKLKIFIFICITRHFVLIYLLTIYLMYFIMKNTRKYSLLIGSFFYVATDFQWKALEKVKHDSTFTQIGSDRKRQKKIPSHVACARA